MKKLLPVLALAILTAQPLFSAGSYSSDTSSAETSSNKDPFSAVYQLIDLKKFSEAIDLAIKIQEYQGAGHSLGIHTQHEHRAHEIAMSAKTCRVIVILAHCFATGGFFDNGLPFSLSMGCGSWGGNSIDGNLNWEHFVNKVRVVQTIEENKPDLEEIFGNYWRETSQ